MSDLSRMDRRKKPQKSTEERNAIIEELVRDREPGAPQAPKRKPKPKKSTVARNIILSVVAVLLLFTAFKVYNFVKSPLNAAEPPETELEEPIDPMLPAEDDEFAKKRVNILVLGIDEREGEPARADTIILASLFPEERQIKLLSIPRDTRLLIPGHGNDKINHAHVYGGINLVKSSVEEFTGIPIDYYVETNFQGFINMIDILGGVSLNVEKKMYKPLENIDLEPGLQTLNGYDSLAYVRYRDDGMGDIGRIGRQQNFIKVLAENTIRTSNVTKIPELVDEMKKYVKTDLSIMDMITYATRFAKMDPADLEGYQVPGFSGMQNEVSYWIPDLNATKKIVDNMKRPTVKEVADGEGTNTGN
ncbi:MAG: LytR family transcriptional regulator [Negativicutes bacterium]|nr:LytR family transcriptional regulator [Negativicutes bacterium]